MERQSSPPLQGRSSCPSSPLNRITKKPSISKVSRRPTGYWHEFNAWYRSELAQGARPSVIVVDRWYEKHAANVWPNKDDRPSGKDARSHAKSLRSTDEVKAYFQRYRAVKKGKGKAGNDDGEVSPNSQQAAAAPSSTLDAPSSTLERMPTRKELIREASLAALGPQHMSKVSSMGRLGGDSLSARSSLLLPKQELPSPLESVDPFGSYTAKSSHAAPRASAPDPLPLYQPNRMPSSTMTVTTCVNGDDPRSDPWAMGIHSFQPHKQQQQGQQQDYNQRHRQQQQQEHNQRHQQQQQEQQQEQQRHHQLQTALQRSSSHHLGGAGFSPAAGICKQEPSSVHRGPVMRHTSFNVPLSVGNNSPEGMDTREDRRTCSIPGNTWEMRREQQQQQQQHQPIHASRSFNGHPRQTFAPMDCDVPERSAHPCLRFNSDGDAFEPQQATYTGRPAMGLPAFCMSPRQHAISAPGNFAVGAPSPPPAPLPLFHPSDHPIPLHAPPQHPCAPAPLSEASHVMCIDGQDLAVSGASSTSSPATHNKAPYPLLPITAFGSKCSDLADTMPSSGERDLPKLDTLMGMKTQGEGAGGANPNLSNVPSWMPSWLQPTHPPSAHLSDMPSWVPSQLGGAAPFAAQQHAASPSPLSSTLQPAPLLQPYPAKEAWKGRPAAGCHPAHAAPMVGSSHMNAPPSPHAPPSVAHPSCVGPRVSSPPAQLATRQSAPPTRKLYYEHLFKDFGKEGKDLSCSSGGTSSGSGGGGGDLPPLTMSQSAPGSNALMQRQDPALTSSASHRTLPTSQDPPAPAQPPPGPLKSAFMERQPSIASPFNTAAFTPLSDQLQLPCSGAMNAHGLHGAAAHGLMEFQVSNSMGLPASRGADLPLDATTAGSARMNSLSRPGTIPDFMSRHVRRSNHLGAADVAAAPATFQFEGLNDQDSLDMLKLQVSGREWPSADGAKFSFNATETPELPSAQPANEISWVLAQNPSELLLRSMAGANSQGSQAEPGQVHRAIPTTAC